MSKIIEIKTLLDEYEKEALINNKLKVRKQNINRYKNDIDDKKIKNLNLSDGHLTLERGGNVLGRKVNRHKIWLVNLFKANKFLIHILVFIVLFILFFKVLNK